MSLSKTEHIRRILDTSFDLPAADVVERLSRKGVDVEAGLVHVTRSTMRKERALQEKQKADEAERQKKEREADLARRKQEEEAELVRLKAVAAKAQQTKALNPQPLRVHILNTLKDSPGATIPEVIERSRKTYKLPNASVDEEEAFKQSVRKKLRLLVLDGSVAQEGEVFKMKPPPVEVPVAVVETKQDGIVALVLQLKQIVAKLGKNEAKELVDVL